MRKRFLIPATVSLLLGLGALVQPPAAAGRCVCDCQTCHNRECTFDGSRDQCIEGPFFICASEPCQPGCPCATT